jgi:molecular chaperone HtpG
MPAGQKDIYYLIGESREMIESSPLLEAFKAKGWEVLLLTDPIDEFLLPSLPAYKEKEFKPVDRGDTDVPADEPAARPEEFAAFLTALKVKLPEVADVRLSRRLKDSASVLVADREAMTAHYERLMKKFGRLDEESKRVLELNPVHPAVAGLKAAFDKDPADPRVEAYGRLLYEEAVIAEGSKLKDPAGFLRRVNDLMARSLGTDGRAA